jgi:hypothetical protein
MSEIIAPNIYRFPNHYNNDRMGATTTINDRGASRLECDSLTTKNFDERELDTIVEPFFMRSTDRRATCMA